MMVTKRACHMQAKCASRLAQEYAGRGDWETARKLVDYSMYWWRRAQA